MYSSSSSSHQIQHHHHHQQQQQQQNQNWLAFSLSNHHMPSDSSLFEAFNSTHCEEDHGSCATTDLSVLTRAGVGGGCPKLEDFLGGNASGKAIINMCHQFSGEAPPSAPSLSLSDTELYDSELKTIAASFLRGFAPDQIDDIQKKQLQVAPPPDPSAKKPVDTFGQRTSIYRGVTRHRWTGRYEAHLWDNSCRREGQSRKGRQVYLGGYDKEEKAARAYDLAALKYWGPTTTTNFPVFNYEKELEKMKNMTRQEFVASLRRKSSGFSRGASIYRGVTRHHQHGRWQARIGRVAGNKDLYLGTFSTQEEAAEAYDIAAIKFRGLNAVTNFDMSRYDVKSIANSNLPIGGMNNKSSKNTTSDSAASDPSDDGLELSSSKTLVSFTSSHAAAAASAATSTLSFGLPMKHETTVQADFWSMLGYHRNSSSLLNDTNKNPNNDGTSLLLQPSSTKTGTITGSTNGGFSTISSTMDSSGTSNNNNSNNNNNNNNNIIIRNGGGGLFVNGGGGFVLHQQSNGTTTNSIPFATPNIALNSITDNAYQGSGNSTFGNWIATSSSLHTFPPAKPNLSVFQTPIFGME